MDDSHQQDVLERWRSLIPPSAPHFQVITHSVPYSPDPRPEHGHEDGEEGEHDTSVVPEDDEEPLEEEIETFPCECRYDPAITREECACGPSSKCVNRELFIECSCNDCPAGAYCQNQRFQRLQYADVQVIPCENKGHGLKTLTDLKPGDFIMEYVGEVLNRRQFQERVRLAEEKQQRHFYFMTIKNGKIIDASVKGNLARFMNHSCNPNCETQKWTVDGRLRVGLFAKKHVKADTELTFDYKFVRFGQAAQQCFCGEPNCKGTIGEDPKKENVDLIRSDSSETDSDDLEGYLPELPVDVEEMARIVKALLRSDLEQTKSLLAALLDVESPADCYKQFLHFHGLKVLASLQVPADSEAVLLRVLLRLPLTNRRQLDDSGIDKSVEAMADCGEKRELLAKWSALSTEYHIPRVSSVPDLNAINMTTWDPMTLDTPDAFKRPKRMISSIQSKGPQMAARPRRRSRSRSPPRSSPRPRPATSHPTQLPPHWRTASTPDGQVYYYNEITKETSWDAPQLAASILAPSFDQACRIVDNSVAVGRLGRALDGRTRSQLAEDLLREFKDASFADLTDGRYKSSVDRFIGDRLYRIQSGR